MFLNAFELDSMGIIPYEDETIDIFCRRGNKVLEVLPKIDDSKMVEFIDAMNPKNKLTDRYIFSTFKHDWKLKQALKYMKKNYGCDLSWIRLLQMKPKYMLHEYNGICQTIMTTEDGILMYIPVIGIVKPKYILHELIHAARNFNKNFWDVNQVFEEDVADNKFYKLNIFCNKNDILPVFINVARKKLRKEFGENYGYVFIRLRKDEVINIIKVDVKKYLIEMSKTSLRHWIMRNKLSLL